MNHTNNALYRQRSVIYIPSDAHSTFSRWAFMFASPDRRTHVPRPKDACPSTEGHMSLDRRTHVPRLKDTDYMGGIKRVKPRL